MKKKYKLFECFGIELEYMLVNKNDLSPASITDQLIIKKNGEITDELENGTISWSNELVLHVVEIKTTKPVATLTGLADQFHQNIQEINELLASEGVMVLPGAMHPLLDPMKDLKLWPHHRNEIYEKYDEIFNCKGHGWGNLQSMHINLPFSNDEEFNLLHDAIRLILPIIPALTASSPYYEGKKGEHLDNRLHFYKGNQKRIPSITGSVIPESVLNKKMYEEVILDKMYQDIAPFDPEGILQEEWLNSRGAITRFDRNAIEIRIIDTQECPKVDLAIAELIVATLKLFIQKRAVMPNISETDLYKIYEGALSSGAAHKVSNKEFEDFIGLKNIKDVSIKAIWKEILLEIELSDESRKIIEFILKEGNLSERLIQKLGSKPGKQEIQNTYAKLAQCVANNEVFTSN